MIDWDLWRIDLPAVQNEWMPCGPHKDFLILEPEQMVDVLRKYMQNG